MNQLDTYYRALLEYKRIADSDAECEAFLRAISEAQSAFESIEIIRNVCTVDEDWVEAIEKGLVHIANAINEERQFILSEGEVVPIEKVKNVSVESVKHLAKHSNLISRDPVDGEIIPDSIYTVERLNDYTVYENRFLYMLLCYLRDFISVRQDKIVELSHKYDGRLTLDKSLDLGGRKISYRIDLKEERKKDRYLRDSDSNKDMIDRRSLIFRTVIALLSTPLMEDAAKASMLKPPITKTNVLKMDKHFRGAVELYDYIIAYDKRGYTTEEQKSVISPFDKGLSDEIAEICSALSFVTYENALGIRPELAHRSEMENERQKAEEIKRYREQIDQLKRRMKNDEIGAEEYILALENKLWTLGEAYESTEGMSERLNSAEREIFLLRAENASLETKNRELDEELELESKRNLKATDTLKSECDKKLAEAEAEYLSKISTAEKTHGESLDSAQKAYSEKLSEISRDLDQVMRENDELKKERAALLEEKLVVEARMKAIMAERGAPGESCTDKESFDELEREYAALTRFYKRQWKQAKKEIRKNLLNFEALRGQ